MEIAVARQSDLVSTSLCQLYRFICARDTSIAFPRSAQHCLERFAFGLLGLDLQFKLSPPTTGVLTSLLNLSHLRRPVRAIDRVMFPRLAYALLRGLLLQDAAHSLFVLMLDHETRPLLELD
mmetsp:Transcript_29303/g.51328  ORF Transcript_29303/g.51328 Transcript_29303/m.51328 type:complete len:122 (+) Transcript_29303:208-573(+)|eukprot:CAMPEP_0195635256 /NCGR_PEP_ID=MMETSP0815-20121206/23171_1 /TAXON_ID=97485 /ORGANISM="Prymnesium parvum, Strain Texoma1" /LENGTH=121 /DNA_ID=CAMNT_0040777151 /DNA_START=186 /DNA_END=551 /DNA_ORIENTATION=+